MQKRLAAEETRDARFDAIADPGVREAVGNFYRAFYDPEKLIRWWAGLYDPDLGGFYYADSARDHKGFLPDMESTYQILWRLSDFIPDLPAFLGPEITRKIVRFFQTKQDPADGYFYHPQWTREASRKNVMRYTRDQDWAIFVLGWLGAKPLYPTAIDRARKDGGKARAYTGWEPNPASVTAFLENQFAETSCEHWANQIETRAMTFKAEGLLDTVLDLLDRTVNPDFGLWVKGYDGATDTYVNLKGASETPYGLFTNAYKIAKTYNIGSRRFPYPEKTVANAIKAIKSRDPGARITYIFNPWATLGNVRENLVRFGTPAEVATYDRMIRDNVLEMVDALGSSLGIYKHADGSYSYLPSGCSSPTIYGTPVSLGVNEGDVNGNNLALLCATHICTAIGLPEMIPIFGKEHAHLMRDLLDRAPKIVKK